MKLQMFYCFLCIWQYHFSSSLKINFSLNSDSNRAIQIKKTYEVLKKQKMFIRLSKDNAEEVVDRSVFHKISLIIE
jgi:peroxiredoxin